jgi:hypothetical protein
MKIILVILFIIVFILLLIVCLLIVSKKVGIVDDEDLQIDYYENFNENNFL